MALVWLIVFESVTTSVAPAWQVRDWRAPDLLRHRAGAHIRKVPSPRARARAYLLMHALILVVWPLQGGQDADMSRMPATRPVRIRAQVPAEEWYCDPCQRAVDANRPSSSSSNGKKPSCPACPSTDGAFKRSYRNLYGGYAHVVCTIFVPGAGFVKHEQMEEAGFEMVRCSNQPPVAATSREGCSQTLCRLDADILLAGGRPTPSLDLRSLQESEPRPSKSGDQGAVQVGQMRQGLPPDVRAEGGLLLPVGPRKYDLARVSM